MPTKQILPPQTRTGRRFLFWAAQESNLDALEEWLGNEFNEADQEKLFRLLRVMSTTSGPVLHSSKEKYSHEFGKIFAIKVFRSGYMATCQIIIKWCCTLKLFDRHTMLATESGH
jgi:hypothetical protein